MQTINDAALTKAELCIWQTARLLERHRFQTTFRGAPPTKAIQTLRAYQNNDGGFGNAIEPDFRGPISQPLSTAFALQALADLTTDPDPTLLNDILRYAKSITTPDGGVPNTLPSVRAYPRAPWWQPAGDNPPGSLLPTANYAANLYTFKHNDPWLETATDFCWRAIAQLIERATTAKEHLDRMFVAYESRSALAFLDAVPDRTRAEQTSAQLGKTLLAAHYIQLDPSDAAAELQPLDLAPTPDALATRWLDLQLLAANLDAVVTSQEEQGGWSVPWPITFPALEHEWRGIYTLDRLKTLRDWGRVRLQNTSE
jgi:hypothetical protein